ncbi:MAG: hypothetical protein HRT36_08610 [Alphaproteobacteria bacterium]|nr:hypothetical protein [Alphaproteobacteria bacterium]
MRHIFLAFLFRFGGEISLKYHFDFNTDLNIDAIAMGLDLSTDSLSFLAEAVDLFPSEDFFCYHACPAFVFTVWGGGYCRHGHSVYTEGGIVKSGVLSY